MKKMFLKIHDCLGPKNIFLKIRVYFVIENKKKTNNLVLEKKNYFKNLPMPRAYLAFETRI